MFDNLTANPEDRIMLTMQKFAADTRANKLDLGVGVYKDAEGKTPIFNAIKVAEKKLWEAEQTKSYVGLAGAPDFNAVIIDLVLGDAIGDKPITSVATPGGTGAVRAAFELIKLASPEATVWVSNPSWSNHPNMLEYLEIPSKKYRYFQPETGTLDFDGMIADLKTAQAGDVVLLHGCCHNPTGLNLTHDQWKEVCDLMIDRGLTPMVDIAYQGFGDGLQEDTFGTRLVAASCPEVLIATSCSKNFGIYRERAGCFAVITQEQKKLDLVRGKMLMLNRLNFSFPPDHGARLVTMVLSDPELRADWETELEAMRTGMLDLRTQLAAELQRQTNSNRFDFVATHRGMFSMLGLDEAQIETMQQKHAVYAISDSRINIAGLSSSSIPVLARAVASVL